MTAETDNHASPEPFTAHEPVRRGGSIVLVLLVAGGGVAVGLGPVQRGRSAARADHAYDGLAVTDPRGHVVYFNAAYLALTGATSAQDVRPVERVFIGNPDVSEAVFRLLKAAREGKRQQEEVRIAGTDGAHGRWLRMRVRPLGQGKRETKYAVWSIADSARDRERQEDVFQELQHAIEYLDHAPCGFFSVNAAGDLVYVNATLAKR